MSKKTLLGTICSVLFLSMATGATAQDTGVAPELLTPVDTRASGMGFANTAVKDNPFGIFGNAAANIFNEKSIGAGYSFNPSMPSLHNGILTHAVGGYWNINENNGLSLGVRSFTGQEVALNDANNNSLGSARQKDIAISLAYTRKIIDGLSASLTARYVNVNNKEFPGIQSGSAFTFDLGVYYTQPFAVIGNGSTWALGLNVSNIGTKLSLATPAAMPAYARLGGAVDMIFSENHKVLAALDLGYTFMPSDAASFTAGLGVEYNFFKYGIIRAGYHLGNDKSIPTGQFATVGAGVKFGPVRVDFSYWLAAKDSPVKNTWSVGLGLFF